MKSIVKDIEKTQLKQPTALKPKPKSSLQLEVKNDQKEDLDDGEEPEYAPPRPADLPYESDILPPGGLSMEGLKNENLFRGFYEHFINPIDDHGVSRQDKKFNDEMKAVIDKAVERNERDLEELDWNIADVSESGKLLKKKAEAPKVAETKMARKTRENCPPMQSSTIRSRKAAAALSIPTDTHKKRVTRPTPPAAPARRPLSSILQGPRASRPAPRAKTPSAGSGTADIASRTTLGYNKGKSASSAIYSRAQSQPSFSARATKTPVLRDDESDLTITPARARRAGLGASAGHVDRPRPQFMSIFDHDDDDEELPPMTGPPLLGDEDDEDFELKLDF